MATDGQATTLELEEKHTIKLQFVLMLWLAPQTDPAGVEVTEYRRDDVGMGCTYAVIVDTMMMISSAVCRAVEARCLNFLYEECVDRGGNLPI